MYGRYIRWFLGRLHSETAASNIPNVFVLSCGDLMFFTAATLFVSILNHLKTAENLVRTEM
jgi:hypothetical protein